MKRDRDPWSWAGIWLVGGVAAVWSFSALSDLAVLVGYRETFTVQGFTIHISWGLPISLDALAIVATRIWLRNTAQHVAIVYARRVAWAAIIASTAGNAYNGWLTGGRIDTVIVGMVPSVALAVLVHLAVLVVARVDTDAEPTTPCVSPLQRLRGWVTIERAGKSAAHTAAHVATEGAAELLGVPVDRMEITGNGVFIPDVEPAPEPAREPVSLRKRPDIHLVPTPPDDDERERLQAVADDERATPTDRVVAIKKLYEGRRGGGRGTVAEVFGVPDGVARSMVAKPEKAADILARAERAGKVSQP